ncbi:Ras and EF-hand domain-containing -like protein [Toxocara canis]|uniref:Ras and EF-hand domain-containing-like protein n=1 Tax=Toxocara canis TaxID=6265 RepID=A0A0B2VRW6_TOXCA|nr:Ras and EF-hand domain-containing -like protein [Toxocara canis]
MKQMDDLTNETERLFDLCDRENKGYLTVNDLKVACPQLDGEARDAEIDFIFASLDADSSGRIDRHEFLGGFQNALCKGESKDKFSGMKRRASAVDAEWGNSATSRKCDFATVYEGTSETENSDSFSVSESLKESTRSDVAVYNSDSDAYSKIDFSLPCQDEVLFLYEQLQSSGMPEILHRFEKVVGNFCKEIRDQKDENVRLQHVFESERQSYSRRMLEVESEIDQHISNAEKKAREEERRRLAQEKEEMRVRLEQEMMELKDNLLSMQKMEDAIRKESTKGEQTVELKAKLQDLTSENQRLKSNLAESQLELAVIKSELLTVKSEFETKKEEMLSDNEAIMETAKQSENLRRQLQLLYDANKKLHDTNDSLREALDQRTLACKQLNLRTPSPLPSPREPSNHSIAEQKEAFGQTSACSTDEDADSGLSLAMRYDAYYSGDGETKDHSSSKPLLPSNSLGFGEADGPPERTFRIVMCGDASVGKSSIVTRIVKGVFRGNLPSTLGVDFQVKNGRVDDKNVAIQLWDTAGQERLPTEESTLKPIPVMVCANKIDLRRKFEGGECRGCVSAQDGRSLASAMGVLFAECSALDGTNVEEALLALTRELMATEDVEVQSSGVILTQKKPSSSCC